MNLQKPIFENPCSYPAVVVALQGIGERSKVKQYVDNEDQENRWEWIAVYCDGVPYYQKDEVQDTYDLLLRILMCCFRCKNCSILLYGTDMCHEHDKEKGHSGFDEEFRWLLKPGPGHIEMNMLKALVEMLWEVFWNEMVKIFNFTSEAALKSAKKVHHKNSKEGYYERTPNALCANEQNIYLFRFTMKMSIYLFGLNINKRKPITVEALEVLYKKLQAM